jgi:hypothetical protein
MLMVRGVDEHEVRGGSADFRTRHHQAEVSRLEVLPARFKAMIHRRGEAGFVARQAVLDAAVHFLVHD